MNRPQPNRKYMPNDFVLNTRDDIKPFYEKFLSQNIESPEAGITNLNDLEEFLYGLDEIDRYMSEEYAVRYIANSCNTTDEDIKARYMSFVTDIVPERTKISNEINKKTVENENLVNQLIAKDPRYAIFFRNLRNNLAMYREENIPLNTQDTELADKYGEITSLQTVNFDGQKNMPLSKLSTYFESPDESVRKSARELYRSRKTEDSNSMIDIISEMVPLRQQIAKNAGFENFATYMFQAKNRFDYSQNDVDNFHHTAETVIKPIITDIYRQKAKLMGKEKLKPRDLKFDPLGTEPLKPYHDSKELVDKTIEILAGLDPIFGKNLQYMYDNNFMDLDARTGKQNGGYNYPLEETGAAFIFMNSNNTQRDLETMVHEAGHAMHGFVMKEKGLNFSAFTSYPSELAEVASMSMELFTAEKRHVFYPNYQEYLRSRINHLESIIETLTHVAAVDNLQKNIYISNIVGPNLNSLAKDIYVKYKYDNSAIDRSGYEDYQSIQRHRQLHIFEVPFYYIEYGIAQLGAIAMRKNYLENPTTGIANYKAFLACGGTKTIPETFAAGGIKFDMSSEYISDLMNFVGDKLKLYYSQLS